MQVICLASITVLVNKFLWILFNYAYQPYNGISRTLIGSPVTTQGEATRVNKVYSCRVPTLRVLWWGLESPVNDLGDYL